MKRDMSDAPLHIVFSLFDANQDGNLASGELVTVGALVPADFLHAFPTGERGRIVLPPGYVPHLEEDLFGFRL